MAGNIVSKLFGTTPPTFKATASPYDKAGKGEALADFKLVYDMLYKQGQGDPLLAPERVAKIYAPANQVAASGIQAAGMRSNEALRSSTMHPSLTGQPTAPPGFVMGGPRPAVQFGPDGAVAPTMNANRMAIALSQALGRGGGGILQNIKNEITAGDYQDKLTTPGRSVDALMEVINRDQAMRSQQDAAKYAAAVAKAKKGNIWGAMTMGAISGAMGGMGGGMMGGGGAK